MRADLIRIYKSVHTWTGIFSGMALFIAFYAGALTVFKEPLARWASPPQAIEVVPLAQAQSLILKTLAADSGAARDFTLHLEDVENVPARMQWQVRVGDDSDDHDESAQRHFVATLDASGGARIHETHPSSLAEFIDVLHRVVGLPFDNDPNRWVMGGVAILYTLALVSGVIVLLPSLVKDFFALRVGKNLKRMWLDAHNVVGIISLPFHLVMALSAVVFAFHDPIYGLQNQLIHGGKWGAAFQRGAQPPHAPPPRDPAAMLAPEAIVAKARALSPGFQPTWVQYQQVTGPRPVARVWGRDDGAVMPRARGGFAAIDPYTGKVLNTDYLPGAQSTANLFISSFFALHMASFGDVAVKWMYFLLGLAGAWLFYSGNLLWVESRRRRAQPRAGGAPSQRLDCRLMASATVGVCLGCLCGVSLMTVAQKWLHGHGLDLAYWTRALYYAAFFLALAWSFRAGAARASVHLLGVAAALTLAIPLTSLLAWVFPSLGLWAHGSAAALGVDFTAGVGALCLAWMARVTWRRIRASAGDSVWSVPSPGAQAEADVRARAA